MKIKTEVIKEMINKVYKGVGNNKLIPITGLITVLLENKVFSLISTTGQSQLIVKTETDEDDFVVSVKADVLYELIQKTTSEFMTLNIQENGLEVSGNGRYLIDIPLDEEGKVIKINFNQIEKSKVIDKINMKELRYAINIHKPSVAETMDVYSLTGFYFEPEIMITTNALVACVSNITYFKNKKILIPNDIVKLFDVFGDTDVKFTFDKELNFEINADNIILCGKLMEEVESYPVTAIQNLANSESNNYVKINKKELLQAVDRLNIFVDEYDKNAVRVVFSEKALRLKNLKDSSFEILDVIETNIKKDTSVTLDVCLFENQLNAYPEDIVSIYFGAKNSIKLISENRSQIIATLIDEGKK